MTTTETVQTVCRPGDIYAVPLVHPADYQPFAPYELAPVYPSALIYPAALVYPLEPVYPQPPDGRQTPAGRQSPPVLKLRPRATHKRWSIANLIFGIFLNPISMILAILALKSSLKTKKHNRSENYAAAKVTSMKSYGFNVAATVSTLVGIIVVIVIAVSLKFTYNTDYYTYTCYTC